MDLRPTLDAISDAQQRIEGVAVRTPLVRLHESFGVTDVWMKLEIHQPINSFKIRGVFNAVAKLSTEQRAAGLNCTSAGNTAQALAWCGRYFGVEARSLMPDYAPSSKVEAVKAYGGTPILVSGPALFEYMQNRGWESERYAFIHAWHNPDVLAGHGTAGIEIVEDCPEVEAVFIPVGGGGLISGVGSALRALKPSIKIIAVEPENCLALYVSLDRGEPSSVQCDTICDGVGVPYITSEVFPVVEALVDDVVLVSEDDVKETIRRLASGNRIITEGAGALSVAAALKVPSNERGTSVCIISGGSIDNEMLIEILSKPGETAAAP